jgi:hypothetical protein
MFKHFNYELNSFIKFSQEKIYLICSLLFIAFLTYGFKIANFTLSIDEDIKFESGSSAREWITDGRWGISVFKTLFHTSAILPFWSSFLSVTFLVATAILWCYILNSFLEQKELSPNKKNIILFIFGAIYLSFPLNAQFVSLSFYNFEIAFASFLLAISSWFGYQWICNTKLKSHFFISYLCLALAVSAYESFACYFLTAIFSFVLLQASPFGSRLGKPTTVSANTEVSIDDQSSKVMGKLFKIFFLVFLAGTTYLIVGALLHLKFPSNGYVSGHILWGKMPVREIVGQMGYFYVGVLFTNPSLFYAQFIVLTLILGIVAFAVYLTKSSTHKLYYTFCFCLMLLSPFLISLLFGGITPLRAFQSAAYLMGFLWVLILISFKNKIINTLLILIGLFIVLSQTQQSALLFQSNYLRYQRDLITANTIANKIDQLGVEGYYPVIFVGQLHFPLNKNIFQHELIGASSFEWGKETAWRAIAFMRDAGYPLGYPSYEQQLKGIEAAKTMPAWPSPKSVAIKDNLIIVKFSND